MTIYQQPQSFTTFTLIETGENIREFLQAVRNQDSLIHQLKFHTNTESYYSYGTALIISEVNFQETSIIVRHIEMGFFYFYLNKTLHLLSFDEAAGTLALMCYENFPELETWMLVPIVQSYLRFDCK